MNLAAILSILVAIERIIPFATKLVDALIQARAEATKAAQERADAAALQDENDRITQVEHPAPKPSIPPTVPPA